MLKIIIPVAVVVAFALPAAAQSTLGPTPKEQNGIHTGTTTTNGSAVLVTDQNGTHPEGYPGLAPRNRTSGDSQSTTHRHHRHGRHHAPNNVQR
jgi:hypothetical protein